MSHTIHNNVMKRIEMFLVCCIFHTHADFLIFKTLGVSNSMKSDVVEINLKLYDTVMHHSYTTVKIEIEGKNNDNLMLLHT